MLIVTEKYSYFMCNRAQILFVFLLGFTFLSVSAQKSIQIEKDEKAISMAKSITAKVLQKHLTNFAGPAMKGRGTMQAGIETARQYILTQLKSADAENQYSKLLPYTITGSKWQKFEIAIGSKKLQLNHDFWLDPGYGSFLAANTRSYSLLPELAYPSNKRMYNAKEAVAIMSNALSAKPSNEVSTNARRMFAAGVKCLFLVVPDTDKVLSEGKPLAAYRGLRKYSSDTAETSANAKCLIYVKYSTWIKMSKHAQQMNEASPSMTISAVPEYNTSFTEYNVMHVFKGKDTSKTLVISAHYDHLGYENGTWNAGADDDGSGSMGLLAIAQAFQKAARTGWKPQNNIALIWFSGEERGLLGSAAYSEKPFFPMDKTLADINIDMIGRCDTAHEQKAKNFIYIIGSNFVSQDLDTYLKQVNTTYSNLPLEYTYNTPSDPNRFYFRSDHYNFAKNSVPCVFFFNGVHADYHKPSDTPEKIDYSAYEERTRLTFYLAYHLAQRTEFLAPNGLGIK